MLRKGNNMKVFMLTMTAIYSVLMSDANAAPKQPEVDKVYADVYKVLKEYRISAVAQDDYNLRVTHKTNKFMIHTIHKTGYTPSIRQDTYLQNLSKSKVPAMMDSLLKQEWGWGSM
jgi:hypothetical protein